MKDENISVAVIESLVHKAFVLSGTDLSTSLQLADKAFLGKNTPFLDFCVRVALIVNYRQCRPTEADVYEWFEENYQKHLGKEWSITKKKNHKNLIPDFWLTNGNTFVPVECKLHIFDKSALRQLKGYMQAYECDKGIAVAYQLTTELPENITFLTVPELWKRKQILERTKEQ